MNGRKKEKLAVSLGRQQRRLVVDQELHDEALKIYNLHGAHKNLKPVVEAELQGPQGGHCLGATSTICFCFCFVFGIGGGRLNSKKSFQKGENQLHTIVGPNTIARLLAPILFFASKVAT